MSKPTVPEVSLIFDDSKQLISNNETQPKSYKVWKQQQQQQCQEPIAKLLTNRIQSCDRKKIVTFDLPADGHNDVKQFPQMADSSPIALCRQLDLSLNEPIGSSNRQPIPVNVTPLEVQYNQHAYNAYMPYRNDNGGGPASQQMPMQNFTNQPTENPKSAAPKEITLNEVYQMLQNMQVNKQSLPTAPINPKSNAINQYDSTAGGLDWQQQMNTRFPCTPNGDPTVRDIFNVILKQQEQLMNLQNQVQLLLMRTASTPMHQPNDSTQYANRMLHVKPKCNEIDARNKQMSVMTSLEINVQNGKSSGAKNATATAAANFHTPQSGKHAAIMGNQSVKQCGCACNCSEQNNVQSSDSGSNDDNLEASPDRGETQTGWTFYGNILNQVNDVLQSTPPAANAHAGDSDTAIQIAAAATAANIENRYNSPNNVPSKHPHSMPQQIRTAQFKQVGFQIDDVNISAMSKR